MPDGVVQWFDPSTGDAAIVRAGRVYAATAGDMESAARHPGARVHFDISHETHAERATNVTLRSGTRVSHRQRRFGDLSGAHRPDTKGTAPFAHAHPELGRALASHPLQVAEAWATSVQGGDLDTALALYAPDAVVHTTDRVVSGRAQVRALLETSGLVGTQDLPDVRGSDGTVTVSWAQLAGGGPGRVVRCRVEHGLIAEQWTEPGAPVAAPTAGAVAIEVSVNGDVDPGSVDYARDRVEAVIDHIGEPVLFTRLKLTLEADPARKRPALAQAALDIGGELVRAHVAAHELREAADLLQRRLLDQLEQRASHRRALRRRSGVPEPGEWRHGDLTDQRPDHYDRPIEERQLVRHKTFALEELTPDEAAFDMDQLDYDFHLFRDLASGEDAVLERADANSHRLTRLHPVEADPRHTAIALTVAEHPPAPATVSDALARLDAGGEPFVFFENSDTGRGNVVYRRYDGHYGLITPA